MTCDNNQNTFLELVKAGLWEKNVQLSTFGNIDISEVYRLAEEQSVIGLVTAGLEYVEDTKFSKEIVLQFVGHALQIEQRNQAMNLFVADLVDKLRQSDIYSLLLKGQGIAQCYERPLWRSAGDVDLFLSEDNYIKAMELLTPLANFIEDEDPYTKHKGMKISTWEVELHGNLRCGISGRVDKMLDLVKDDVFYCGDVRSWLNGKTQIFLMKEDNDVVYVFSHIIHHFFHGGIGLRQICDWCRLLWTYRDSIRRDLLEKRLHEMALMSEWKTFAALAVNCLGMPKDAMPFYSDSGKWCKKSEKVLAFVLETGNMGHNRDMSYRSEESALKRKWKTFYHISADTLRQFSIFPMDSIVVWCRMMRIGFQGLFCGN